MKFQPTQLISVHFLMPLYAFSFLALPVSGQNAAEEPAQSVLKAETAADNPAEEPQEFIPPTITLGSADSEEPGEFFAASQAAQVKQTDLTDDQIMK